MNNNQQMLLAIYSTAIIEILAISAIVYTLLTATGCPCAAQ